MSAPTQYRHHVTHTTARASRLILGSKIYSVKNVLFCVYTSKAQYFLNESTINRKVYSPKILIPRKSRFIEKLYYFLVKGLI